MPPGISKIKSLYSVLRSKDADCLDFDSVILLLQDIDKRLTTISIRLETIERPTTVRPS